MKTAEELVKFVLDHCIARTAGTYSTFAYLWQRDWDEFEQAAENLGISADEYEGIRRQGNSYISKKK